MSSTAGEAVKIDFAYIRSSIIAGVNSELFLATIKLTTLKSHSLQTLEDRLVGLCIATYEKAG